MNSSGHTAPVEAVVFSHYAAIDPQFAASISMLFDRVIFPLADWSASENALACELRSHCPALNHLQTMISPLREGPVPLSRPLTEGDTPLACYDCESFKKGFNAFLDDNGINWDALCQHSDLSGPFQTLHCFIARSLVKHSAQVGRVSIFYTEPLAFAPTLVSKIATILEVELSSYAVAKVDVAPHHVGQIRNVLQHCPARAAYRADLFCFAEDLAAKIQKAETDRERRDIVLDKIDGLKRHYDAWIERLRSLERLGWLRIRESEDNILHVARCRYWASRITLRGGIKGFFEVAIDVDRQPLAAVLRDDPQLRETAAKITWQHHLLAMQTRVDALGPARSDH